MEGPAGGSWRWELPKSHKINPVVGPWRPGLLEARQDAVNHAHGREVPPDMVPSLWEACKRQYVLRRPKLDA